MLWKRCAAILLALSSAAASGLAGLPGTCNLARSCIDFLIADCCFAFCYAVAVCRRGGGGVDTDCDSFVESAAVSDSGLGGDGISTGSPSA